jgi:hypothetical protein
LLGGSLDVKSSYRFTLSLSVSAFLFTLPFETIADGCCNSIATELKTAFEILVWFTVPKSLTDPINYFKSILPPNKPAFFARELGIVFYYEELKDLFGVPVLFKNESRSETYVSCWWGFMTWMCDDPSFDGSYITCVNSSWLLTY